MSVFKNYSKYYDLLYQEKNYQGETDYIDSLIRKYAPHTENVFEMGCGTGRHAILLSEKNYNVHGIDQSADMLKEAKGRLKNLSARKARRLSFKKGDIRSYQTSEKFDTVMSLFHVISYQVTNKDLIAALNTAKYHLDKNGIFIFDCWYGPAVLAEKPETRIKKLEDKKIKVIRIAEPEIHPNENCVDVNYTVLIQDKKTGKTETLKETHKMRYLFAPELEMTAESCGLKIIAREEWMTRKKPGFDTWGVCFVAKNKS